MLLDGVAVLHVMAAALPAPHLHEHYRHYCAQRGPGEFRYLVAWVPHLLRRPIVIGLVAAWPDRGVAPVVAIVVGRVAVYLVLQVGRSHELGVLRVIVRVLARAGASPIVGPSDGTPIALVCVAAHSAPLFVTLAAY